MNKSARRTSEIIANMRIIWKEPFLLVAILAIFYFLILFVAFPIFQVFRYSLVIDKQFDLSNYLAVFSARD
jgi:iron(III) transport system permease protein